ncbi:hypothetical protein GWI33_019416 [Rhynchophorus ferrugineus]|uniref:Uncharacterized protein n=1 Tax=Rhynchophorus ferrugineus TaxID=354439 RepID=A0A834M1E3_RHYFE|nr:hypothetical protein GWI33_019416 [Rhynchophorus ferrugineus]
MTNPWTDRFKERDRNLKRETIKLKSKSDGHIHILRQDKPRTSRKVLLLAVGPLGTSPKAPRVDGSNKKLRQVPKDGRGEEWKKARQIKGKDYAEARVAVYELRGRYPEGTVAEVKECGGTGNRKTNCAVFSTGSDSDTSSVQR